MTTAAQVAKQAQQLGKQLKAVIEVGDFLEELGNLEQAISEADHAKTVAVDQRAEAQNELVLTKAALVAEQANLQAAKNTSRQVIDDAKARSEQLLASARNTATETLNTVGAQANERIAEGTASVKRLEKKRASLEIKTAQLEANYTTLKRGLTALHERVQVDEV